jgi:hypothetical protein
MHVMSAHHAASDVPVGSNSRFSVLGATGRSWRESVEVESIGVET